jgi:hypothetical protein
VFDSRQLQQLVDTGRFDDLLQVVSLTEVAQAWMRYQKEAEGGDHPGLNDPDWLGRGDVARRRIVG